MFKEVTIVPLLGMSGTGFGKFNKRLRADERDGPATSSASELSVDFEGVGSTVLPAT